MVKLRISTTVEPDLLIWLKAQARDEKSSIAHQIRWALYEMKARSDMRSMKP